MASPLTCRSTDHSDLKQFAFSFFCDKCGSEWKSPARPFEQGGFSAVEHEITRQLIWEQEHRAAFDLANQHAVLRFNYCRQCEKWVCDDCFDAEGDGNGEFCRECCSKLEVIEG